MAKGRLQYIVEILLICVLFFAGQSFVYAQVRDAEKADAPAQIRPFSDMWTVRTNVFEWAAIIPNFGFEFDLSNSIYNRQALGLTAKYNWKTTHKLAPSLVYDMFEIRPEYRFYTRNYLTRTKAWSEQKRDTVNVWTTHHDGRVKYIGAYANYNRYAFLLGKTGFQGTAIGLGVSGGYVFNLYTFNKGALDLELGASLGLQVTDYEAFTHNRADYTYKPLPEKSKTWHVTPFPVVSELRAAFCWRHVSAQEKYSVEDPREIHYRQDLETIQGEVRTWRKGSFDDRMSRKELEAYAADKEAYRRDFVQYVEESYNDAMTRYADFEQDPERMTKNQRKRLASYLAKAKTKTIHDFDAAVRKGGNGAVEQDSEANAPKVKEAKVKEPKAVKEPKVKEAKTKEPKAVKEPKVKEPKAAKEPKVKEPKVKEPKPEKSKKAEKEARQ